MNSRRTLRLLGLLVLLVLAGAALSACGATPRAQADRFASFIPEEYNDWERDDRDTVRLRSNTIFNIGHVTMIYEGPDDAIAYIVIEVHPTEDAAEVAATTRLREWHLQGLELDANRAPQQVTADVAQTDRVRYALLQDGSTVVEIDAIAAEGEAPISDEAFEDLLFIVRNAFKRVAES
jgi:hypothetical protein